MLSRAQKLLAWSWMQPVDRSVVLLWLGVAALGLAGAEPDHKAAVKAAAEKLAAQPNYAWTTTSRSEEAAPAWQMGPVEGKTIKDGPTHFAGSFNDNPFEVAIQGNRFALKRGGEWESCDTIEQESPRLARRIKEFMLPAAEASMLLARTKALAQESEGALSGELTEAGVKEIIGRWWRGGAEPAEPQGRVRFWLRNGALAKYQYTIQAKLTVGQGQQPLQIHRTITVEIKDVGTTRLNLPEEVKKILAAGGS